VPPLPTERDVPPALAALVYRSLAKTPESRWASARAMAMALDAASGGRPSLTGHAPPGDETLPLGPTEAYPSAPQSAPLPAPARPSLPTTDLTGERVSIARPPPPAWRSAAVAAAGLAVGLGAVLWLVGGERGATSPDAGVSQAPVVVAPPIQDAAPPAPDAAPDASLADAAPDAAPPDAAPPADPVARAAQAATAGDDDVERARLYVELAIRHFEAGDYGEALEAFRKAEPLGDPAGLRYNIARCLEEMGRDAEAHAAFQAYLELPDRPELREAAKEKMAALGRRLWGQLAVQCDAEGVRLSAPALTPTEAECPHRWLKVPPGDYEIEGASPDGAVGRARVTVEAGVALSATVRLPGLLTVEGPAGASLSVDDAPQGALPLPPLELSAGAHTLTLTAADGRTATATAAVEAGRASTVPMALAPPPAEPPPAEPPPEEPPPEEPPPEEPPPEEPPPEAPPPQEPPPQEPPPAATEVAARLEPEPARLDRGHVDLTVGSGAAFYDGESYRQHVNLGFGLAFGVGPIELGVETQVLVESPLAVAMRPELRLPLGVAFLRAGANLMVVASTVFGALLGAGVQVPLSPRLAFHLGVDGTLWPTASVSQIEGRTGLAVKF
jgi:hypothetical protein